MKALIQRVRQARVEVAGERIGSIDEGLLVLVGVEREDDRACADKLLHKLLRYRVFRDDHDKMNRSLSDVGGGLLLVSQFTLAADTSSGLRPSFSTAAPQSWAKTFTIICSVRRVCTIRMWPAAVSVPICRSTCSTTGR